MKKLLLSLLILGLLVSCLLGSKLPALENLPYDFTRLELEPPQVRAQLSQAGMPLNTAFLKGKKLTPPQQIISFGILGGGF